MPLLTRRSFALGLGAALVTPAILKFSLRTVSAEDFGLRADGQTNGVPALRNMLAEVERKGQGTIRLPAGRILLNPDKNESALILPAKVRLEGAGADKTVLFMADGAAGHVINAPYGWVQIANLTVDGNEAGRPGVVSHNIRFNGEQVVIEHVRCINSVSYGIAIAQRHYARDVVVRDVEIVNTGADGIDIKNRLKKTEGIRIENVTVRGFGRPERTLDPKFIGTSRDIRAAKAGVDLRGKCQVRGLTVDGVMTHREGLRFRHGDQGAAGSTAAQVRVRGTKGQKRAIGITVASADVVLEDIDIADAAVGLVVGDRNLKIARGKVEGSAEAAIWTRTIADSRPDRVDLTSVAFKDEAKFQFQVVDSVRFDDCTFSDCRGALEPSLKQDPRVVLKDCRFDGSCRDPGSK